MTTHYTIDDAFHSIANSAFCYGMSRAEANEQWRAGNLDSCFFNLNLAKRHAEKVVFAYKFLGRNSDAAAWDRKAAGCDEQKAIVEKNPNGFADPGELPF
jgi:hypothetical protein